MATATVSVVETESNTGEYGMSREAAIIEHPEHGRLYISQGFGGIDSLAGGAIRWRHGLVVKLQPGDTIASLRDAMHNPELRVYDAMVAGYAEGRPLLPWDGRAVELLAKAAGLI